MDENRRPNSHQADNIYRAPGEAQASARAILANQDSSANERAEALAAIGRAAYYDNRMHDAIAVLNDSLRLAEDADLRMEIVLILTPAMSKDGQHSAAIDLLDNELAGAPPMARAKAHNQRGIILAETGQLSGALEAFAASRDDYQSLEDHAAAGRSLLNMAAAASELGRQDDAERWYEEAWQLTQNSGESVMSAMIEGNLGYVASRKGDFGEALRWYERGRSSFAALGDVDLLVAVLEADHASTLLDIGLNADAIAAADAAFQSASGGDNKMLQLRTRLLSAEASLRIGSVGEAIKLVEEATTLANTIKAPAWQLRCSFLQFLARLARDPEDLNVSDAVKLHDGLKEADLAREALSVLLHGAESSIDRSLHDAQALLAHGENLDGSAVDSIDYWYWRALRCHADGDLNERDSAISKGLQQLEAQRLLVGPGELQIRLGHRVTRLRSLALRNPLQEADGDAALAVRERTRLNAVERSAQTKQLASRARDQRVAVEEASDRGDAMRTYEAIVRELPATTSSPKSHQPQSLLRDIATIVFIEDRGSLWAVHQSTHSHMTMIGHVDDVAHLVRSQRASIRKQALGDDRSSTMARVVDASKRLDELLLAPFKLDRNSELVLVPETAVAGICWSALPSLAESAYCLATGTTHFFGDTDPISINSAGLLASGNLASTQNELDSIAALWHNADQQPNAMIATAHTLMSQSDVVHIASHGRAELANPFLSAIEFEDGDLRLLDLETHDRLAPLMILAACDAGACAAIGGEAIGFSEALLSLGVRCVASPALLVEDSATRRLVTDLHSGLSTGLAPHIAMRNARALARQRSRVEDHAASASFQLHGTAAATRPLQISRI